MSRSLCRSPPPHTHTPRSQLYSGAFRISLVFQLLQGKHHYSVSLNWPCCVSSASSGRVQRKCSRYFTQRMHVDGTGAPGRGSYEMGCWYPPLPFLFFPSLSLSISGSGLHVLVPHVLYSQGSDHIWCFYTYQGRLRIQMIALIPHCRGNQQAGCE